MKHLLFQELLKQREQLERTDKRLDDINETLRFSHKHIQGIKVMNFVVDFKTTFISFKSF